MRRAIGALVEGLRGDGFAVGPGEAIDAARAAEAVGVEDRATLRAALAATLAKTRPAQAAFERHFARVFAAPATPDDEKRGKRGAGGAGRSGLGGRGEGERPGPTSTREPRGSPNGPAPRAPVRDGRPRREAARGTADAGGERTEARVPRPRRAAPSTPVGRGEPRRWNLAAPLALPDEAAVLAELPRLLGELSLASSRRRRTGRRGPLDVQRALRANQAHGGVPFRLPRRERRKAPPHLAFLLDVSHSAARGAGLLLLAARAVLRRFRDARVFVFVDRPVDATALVRAWLRGELAPDVLAAVPAPPPTPYRRPGARPPDVRRRGHRPGAALVPPAGGPSFAALLDTLPALDRGRPSDYGRALVAFAEEAARWPRNTLLVVYGDGRTNRFPPCPWAVEELVAHLRRVVWLVGEPRARWGTGDSALPALTAAVDALYEVETAEALVRAIREVT